MRATGHAFGGTLKKFTAKVSGSSGSPAPPAVSEVDLRKSSSLLLLGDRIMGRLPGPVERRGMPGMLRVRPPELLQMVAPAV